MWRGDELDINDVGLEIFRPERLFGPLELKTKTTKTL
jgi:hypothetical protein